jgi:hypothetical protein
MVLGSTSLELCQSQQIAALSVVVSEDPRTRGLNLLCRSDPAKVVFPLFDEEIEIGMLPGACNGKSFQLDDFPGEVDPRIDVPGDPYIPRFVSTGAITMRESAFYDMDVD